MAFPWTADGSIPTADSIFYTADGWLTSGFINDQSASSGSVNSSAISAPAININPGAWLTIATRYTNAAAQSVVMSDNAGGNSYVPLTTFYNATFGVGGAFFYVRSALGGNTIFTATFGAASNHLGIYVGQYTGLTALIGTQAQEEESPGTGANAYTSGNVTVGMLQVPALAWGFIVPVHNYNLVPAAGTSPLAYTGRSLSWPFNTGTNNALAEDIRLTVPGNYPATFTVAENSGRFVLIAVFREGLAPIQAPPPSQFFMQDRLLTT